MKELKVKNPIEEESEENDEESEGSDSGSEELEEHANPKSQESEDDEMDENLKEDPEPKRKSLRSRAIDQTKLNQSKMGRSKKVIVATPMKSTEAVPPDTYVLPAQRNPLSIAQHQQQLQHQSEKQLRSGKRSYLHS